MENAFYLNDTEELLLMTVVRLGRTAYGVRLRQEMEAITGRSTAIGTIYATLERLEERGFVSSWEGDPTPERGGRAKRFYEVTGAGEQALDAMQRLRWDLRSRPLQGTELAVKTS